MEAHQKALNKAKIALMSRPDSAFFTTVCFSLKHQWDESVKTAETDGRTIWTNPEFFMKLNTEEQVFLMLHETLHAAYLHMSRMKGRQPRKWNIAADHVINLQLIDRGFRMPEGGLADRQYAGMSVEQVYDLLPEPESEEPMDLVVGDGSGSNEELQQEMEEILIRAKVQSEISGDKPGTIPGDIEIFLNKLLDPILPWNQILRKYMNSFNKNDYSFRKPNRRFFPNHILPGMFSTSLMDIAIAVDTSGSVTDTEFLHFISEVHSIMKYLRPQKITIIQFDTEIKSVDEVRGVNDLQHIKFTGRGGTYVPPVFEWARENKPKLLMIFSDGYFHTNEMPEFDPLVWIIHQNPNFKPPQGKVIHYHMP